MRQVDPSRVSRLTKAIPNAMIITWFPCGTHELTAGDSSRTIWAPVVSTTIRLACGSEMSGMTKEMAELQWGGRDGPAENDQIGL